MSRPVNRCTNSQNKVTNHDNRVLLHIIKIGLVSPNIKTDWLGLIGPIMYAVEQKGSIVCLGTE
jgi:hypothetical protein